MNQIPTLFVLEDSEELLADVLEVAKQQNWRTISSNCIDTAISEMAACSGAGINAMLLDIMLPKSLVGFNQVTTLSNERVEKSLALASCRNPEARNSILTELRRLDKEIRTHIVLDGGVRFLEEVSAKGLLKAYTKVAMFSALRPDAASDDNTTYGSRVRQALGTVESKWFQKPVDPMEIEDWLKGCVVD